MIDQNIKQKIQKLFALANCKGASEDEAATAMRMAMGLMARHGIAESDLGGEISKAKRGAPIRKKFEAYQIIVAIAAAHLYGCRLLMYNKGKDGILFVGRTDNMDAVEMTTTWLTEQLERLYKQSLPKGLTQQARSEFRKTFKWACALRVQQRVFALVEEMQRSDVAAQAATGRNALVVQGHFKQMLQEADEAMGNARPISLKAKVGSGTAAGHTAGDRVQIGKEVS